MCIPIGSSWLYNVPALCKVTSLIFILYATPENFPENAVESHLVCKVYLVLTVLLYCKERIVAAFVSVLPARWRLHSICHSPVVPHHQQVRLVPCPVYSLNVWRYTL